MRGREGRRGGKGGKYIAKMWKNSEMSSALCSDIDGRGLLAQADVARDYSVMSIYIIQF